MLVTCLIVSLLLLRAGVYIIAVSQIANHTVSLILLGSGSRSAEYPASGVSEIEGVIANIRVCVPAMWIGALCACVTGVGRHEPTQVRVVISRPEIIQARLGIAFFAGEFMRGACVAGYLFAVGQVVHRVLHGLIHLCLQTSRVQMIFLHEI